MTEPEEMWTPEVAAPKVGKSPNWLKEKARAGEIPYHRIGRTIMFTPGDVAEIIENGAVPAGAPSRRPGRKRTLPQKVVMLQSRPVNRDRKKSA